MIIRQLLARTVLLIGVCLAVANTAFAFGDTCNNVAIKLTNETKVKIKVTKFEYYDYDDKQWRTEVMFGVDGYTKLEPGKAFPKTQDLEHIENDNTKFKVTYEADGDGTKSGDPVTKTTSDFICKDNIPKEVVLDVEPPLGDANTTGDTCSNVPIKLTNATKVKIKVTKFEYYDYDDKQWRTEVMFGVDGYTKLQPGEVFSKTQDLEHIEDDNTKFKVTYEEDVDANKSGNPVTKTTSDFICKDNMPTKEVVLDVEPPPGDPKNCDWTVSGTVKVETQEDELRTKFGTQIPLKGIQVKVSGATIGGFDSWDTVSTGSDGKFTVTKEKSCEDRKLKIEVQFENDDVKIIKDPGLIPTTGAKWYTIIEDSERRRKADTIQIVPTVFAAGKNHDLSDFDARHHADIWVIVNTLRDHVASFGSAFKFTKRTTIEYPNNDQIIPDGKEGSFTNPLTGDDVNIFVSNDGTVDHLNVDTLFHEMMHVWAFEHTSGERGMAANLVTSFSTHCVNKDESVSFHEGFAEFANEKLKEEIFPLSFKTLPFNRDALNEGLSCDGGVNKITNLLEVERHEFGWMSFLRMLTTNNLSDFTYKGEASSTDPGDSSVFISLKPKGIVLGTCSNPTNKSLKNILDVFLPHSDKGFSKNMSNGDMNVTDFMNRAAKILNFEDQKSGLTNILDPSKTTEPSDEICSITPVPKRRH